VNKVSMTFSRQKQRPPSQFRVIWLLFSEIGYVSGDSFISYQVLGAADLLAEVQRKTRRSEGQGVIAKARQEARQNGA